MKRMMRIPTSALGALTLAACGGSGATPQTAARPGSTSPSASVAASPTPAPSPPSGTAPKGPFNVIGELHGEYGLVGAGERGFLFSQAGIELELVGDEVTHDPQLKRGLPHDPIFFSVDGVGGRYPDALWLSATLPSGRTGFSSLWRWDGKSWREQTKTQESRFITGVQAWSNGRMLALEQNAMLFDASFRLLSGDPHVAIPQFQRASRTEEFSYCQTQLKPDVFAALPSGDVLAAGLHCDPEQNYQELAVERWAPGAKRSSIDIMPDIHGPDALPDVSFTATSLAALSATDVYLAAVRNTLSPAHTGVRSSSYFAHFDGKSWQALPSPIPGGVNAMWIEDGGVIFATDGQDGLWSRSVAGVWAPVPWPAELVGASIKLGGLWPRAAGDTWALVQVVGSDNTHSQYLLHTRPATKPLPSLEVMDRKDRELRLPGPPVDWCDTRFVLLYTLGRKAPADYDYPATRTALKGHREFAEMDFVEFSREGRRYFGARVPDFDVGKRLAKLIKDKVPGSTPELVCLDPVETRKLDIDFSSGHHN